MSQSESLLPAPRRSYEPFLQEASNTSYRSSRPTPLLDDTDTHFLDSFFEEGTSITNYDIEEDDNMFGCCTENDCECVGRTIHEFKEEDRKVFEIWKSDSVTRTEDGRAVPKKGRKNSYRGAQWDGTESPRSMFEGRSRVVPSNRTVYSYT